MLPDYILKRYENAPLISTSALPSYRSLAQDITRLYDVITGNPTPARATIFVVSFVDRQPYDSARDMFEDMHSGRLKISTQYNEHPFFTKEDNLKARAVHDAYHYWSNSDFSLEGEYKAFELQAGEVAEESVPALYSEVVLQAAYTIRYGKFPVQKVFTL
jgi:hypothetical protein